jgi:hypothetical protein
MVPWPLRQTGKPCFSTFCAKIGAADGIRFVFHGRRIGPEGVRIPPRKKVFMVFGGRLRRCITLFQERFFLCSSNRSMPAGAEGLSLRLGGFDAQCPYQTVAYLFFYGGSDQGGIVPLTISIASRFSEIGVAFFRVSLSLKRFFGTVGRVFRTSENRRCILRKGRTSRGQNKILRLQLPVESSGRGCFLACCNDCVETNAVAKRAFPFTGRPETRHHGVGLSCPASFTRFSRSGMERRRRTPLER